MYIFILRLLARLKFRSGMAFGAILGRLLYVALPERRHVVKINLRHCFPDLDQRSLNAKALRVFVENGRGIIETAWAWYAVTPWWLKYVHYNNVEDVKKRLETQAVLLCCPHVSMLDLCAPILNEQFKQFVVTYRPHKKPWLEKEILSRRGAHCQLINVRDIRGIIGHLRVPGTVVWFAPDQDMGSAGSVVVNFFGKPAATVTTPGRLAAISGCAVSCMFLYRDESGYETGFEVMSIEFPTNDRVLNAQMINDGLERMIMKHSDQYLWLHRRYKSVRDGNGRSVYD